MEVDIHVMLNENKLFNVSIILIQSIENIGIWVKQLAHEVQIISWWGRWSVHRKLTPQAGYN